MLIPILQFPGDHTRELKPGTIVKLGRFEDERWVVNYGWYSCDDSRPVCGWYFASMNKCSRIKPIHPTDLDDIYLTES